MLAGHRLAGSGADRDAICDALLAHGANPLLVAAFRARRPARRRPPRLNNALNSALKTAPPALT